jgi:hypothetical protein
MKHEKRAALVSIFLRKMLKQRQYGPLTAKGKCPAFIWTFFPQGLFVSMGFCGSSFIKHRKAASWWPVQKIAIIQKKPPVTKSGAIASEKE